mmetsp:Transcript_11757/g.23132  ORF Transcript_11757/g.23132 Transcript_11757/m.23132 type:complete len:241 (+) Transcript_11757:116-838(+)|eukprot:CAMPEP_0171487834 /NCGR_PEP_ID=MMETSP0958-20121227/1869_1 /TAXON_ID=87120 /ORGANISM="Aurantiochytrium limacinum, Strain ATCCMYA-1381" /LENGTH=240 /DNA_ID=CAMNT_0012020875 /DNA_START=21 /DNA_END=743 /DNA_ORIENTATION=+
MRAFLLRSAARVGAAPFRLQGESRARFPVAFGRGLSSSTRDEDAAEVARNADAEPRYAEELQKAQIKSPEFYEKHSHDRKYFYHVDLLGRLFLEDMLPKNIATSLKSPKFLNFFFTRLRPNTLGEFEEYPYVSPCGKEMNYIRPADTPIVFDRLETDEEDGKEYLMYASDMKEPFDPSLLQWASDTDRLYYPIREHKRMKGERALVRSHLAVQLSQHFILDGEDIYLEWNGGKHLIELVH